MTRRYIVTGGGGFVGKALAKALRAAGHQVLSISRASYPELQELGITSAQIDISSDPSTWCELFTGVDGVFHTAAKVDMWGSYEGFFKTNVIGTRNVIEACRRASVTSLVFTSSPSVIHDGAQLNGVDESYPYPKHFPAFYPQTKAQAEQEVLASDCKNGLRTVALRPHLIWGPNDTNLIPTILERAKLGRLTRIGDGSNLVDLTFIDDCVTAHLCAMRTLETKPDLAGGKVYFISQGEPTKLWSWIDQILKAHGLAPVVKSLSKRAATVLAYLMEGYAGALGLLGIETKPLLTRFLVSEMSTNHYFSIERARIDLGFTPAFTMEQAFKRTFTQSV